MNILNNNFLKYYHQSDEMDYEAIGVIIGEPHIVFDVIIDIVAIPFFFIKKNMPLMKIWI